MSTPGEEPEGAEPGSSANPVSGPGPDGGEAEDGSAGGDAVPPAAAPAPEPEWRRRRRLAEVFGDEQHATGRGDDWYRDQVPPHHG